jgi:arylsulfatase B
VFVLADDGGYGDLACHGNSYVQTPNLDTLREESTRFTDFHVSPCCSPSRAQLMTGRYPNRTGVWHTVLGRSLLHRNEVTMADAFRANGYRTALFGKWHLGDNYPYRPQDRGFEEVLSHGGGGVGNLPDYWANNYFENTFFRNGTPEEVEGFCCDVWFREAASFIERNQEQPFFCFVSSNTPHLPFVCEDRYYEPYDLPEISESMGKFYGMMTNIDDNVGALRRHLVDLDLADNTIFIFMTDNGSSRGHTDKEGYYSFNAGMRGGKGSAWDGGHRVPFFLAWPRAGVSNGGDVDTLCAGFDLLPTLEELCNLEHPEGPELDGQSLVPLMDAAAGVGAATAGGEWPERTLVVDNQRIIDPLPWRVTAVMTQRWRLVRAAGQQESELFDIENDPGQQSDVAAAHPQVVARMSAAYQSWWDSWAEARAREYEITIGAEQEPTAMLTAMDVNGASIWNHDQVLAAKRADGFWALDVAVAGEYELALARWPREVGAAVTDAIDIPAKLKPLIYYSPGLDYAITHDRATAVSATYARLRIQDHDLDQPIDATTAEALFRVRLRAGSTRLQTWFVNGADDGDSTGAYYAYVTRLGD